MVSKTCLLISLNCFDNFICYYLFWNHRLLNHFTGSIVFNQLICLRIIKQSNPITMEWIFSGCSGLFVKLTTLLLCHNFNKWIPKMFFFCQSFIPLVLTGSNSFNIYYFSCWLQIMIVATTLTNTLFGLGGLSVARIKLTSLVLNT